MVSPENRGYSSYLTFILRLPQLQEPQHIEGALQAGYHGKGRPHLLSTVMHPLYFSIVHKYGPSSEIHRSNEELCYCLESVFDGTHFP